MSDKGYRKNNQHLFNIVFHHEQRLFSSVEQLTDKIGYNIPERVFCNCGCSYKLGLLHEYKCE